MVTCGGGGGVGGWWRVIVMVVNVMGRGCGDECGGENGNTSHASPLLIDISSSPIIIIIFFS